MPDSKPPTASTIWPIVHKKKLLEDALFRVLDESTDENARDWAFDALRKVGSDVSKYCFAESEK